MVSTRELATVLFTDIVGSTEQASRLGDRGWRELLRLHDERVRAELERYKGREVNTVGDGFVATFDDPERAIRCACAIRTAVAPLGLAVRCGLHMGEVEREGREVRGIAVHIGARVAAQADPGEVLVSSTVREMVAGSGFGFEDRGARPLKGVPGEWRLSAVTSEPARVPVAGRWRVVRRRLPRLTPGHAVLAAVAAFVLLVALSSLYFRDPAAERGAGPRPVIAAGSPLGVAVLPFSVTSPRLADWRESMVTLLTTNLDGLGGLRAIDSRTVLARWRERVPAGASPDLQAMLDVARHTGARYALVGAAVSIGDRVRLSVDVYDVEEGAHLGHGQVDGGSEGVFQMVDELSIRVLEALAQEEERELPGVSLASVTTDSLRALRHFLAGEAAFRRSDFDRAISAYQNAVAVDSTFALALYRLWYASSWIENVAAAAPFLERAARFRARLPERQALLLEAARAYVRGRGDAIGRLRNVVQTFPDDTEAWNLLGEAFFHLGAQALVGQEQSDRAFSRAVQLDPAFAPSHVHLVENAFTLYADSARAAQRIDAYGRLAAGTDLDRRNRLAFGLAFADSAGHARARSALADASAFDFLGLAMNYLWHPRFLAVQGELLERAVTRPEEADAERARVSLFANRLARGRLQDALRLAGGASFPRRFRGEALYAARQLGAEVEVSQLEVELRSSASDSLPDLRMLGSAALAADRGQWADHAAALDRVRALADTAWAAGDSAAAEYARAVAQGLQGYALWKDGKAADAVPLLEAAQRRATGWGERAKVNAALRFWLGSLLLELGRDADAVGYLAPRPAERFNSRTLGVWYWQDALAAYRLGEAYERLGRTGEAVLSYRYALESWEEADPALAALVAHAREALGRLAPSSASPPMGAGSPN